MLILTGLGLILALTVLTGYFVAQEFSYIASDRSKLQAMATDGDAAAERALQVMSRLSFMLSGAQLGITITALLAGYVAEPFLGEGMAALLDTAGVSKAASMPIALALALLLATVIQMVLGELAPKNWGIAKPETLAKALSRSTLIYLAVAGPVIRVFDGAANRLLRAVGIQPVDELPAGATRADLDHIVAESGALGHLDPATSKLLDHGLDFRDLTAGQVMVPRVDVITVHAADPVARVVELFATGRSRFPILGAGGSDDVIGMVGAAQVRTVPAVERATTTVGAVADHPVRVPESLPVAVVLERLRAAHRQLAIVIDEYGGFAGVVSLEDIAEELVGPILDEDDRDEPAPVLQPDGSWLVPGRWRIDEIHDTTGIALPEGEEYETVSGLVLRHLGHIPTPGDTVDVELANGHNGNGHPVTDGHSGFRHVTVEVITVRRHVPDTVRLTFSLTDAGSDNVTDAERAWR